jgi:hypothetical protein
MSTMRKSRHTFALSIYINLGLFGREMSVGEGSVMSNLKAPQPSGQPAEPEGSIRELVLQQGGAGRQTNDNCEKSAGELASLLKRV